MNDELLYFTPKMKHNITKKQNKSNSVWKGVGRSKAYPFSLFFF